MARVLRKPGRKTAEHSRRLEVTAMRIDYTKSFASGFEAMLGLEQADGGDGAA